MQLCPTLVHYITTANPTTNKPAITSIKTNWFHGRDGEPADALVDVDPAEDPVLVPVPVPFPVAVAVLPMPATPDSTAASTDENAAPADPENQFPVDWENGGRLVLIAAVPVTEYVNETSETVVALGIAAPRLSNATTLESVLLKFVCAMPMRSFSRSNTTYADRRNGSPSKIGVLGSNCERGVTPNKQSVSLALAWGKKRLAGIVETFKGF